MTIEIDVDGPGTPPGPRAPTEEPLTVAQLCAASEAFLALTGTLPTVGQCAKFARDRIARENTPGDKPRALSYLNNQAGADAWRRARP